MRLMMKSVKKVVPSCAFCERVYIYSNQEKSDKKIHLHIIQ